jgi:hypothetical protein
MSSEKDNMITILKKHPVASLFVFIAVAVVIFTIVFTINIIINKRDDNNNTPKPTTKEGFSSNIVENYPQTTPMNIMYSDANGNLATSNDLGLQNLTVASDSSFGGNVGITGKVTASSADVSDMVTASSATLKNLTVNGDSVITGKSTVNGVSRVSTIGANTLNIDANGSVLLGNKFRLNGGKDAWADDDWLRIMNKENTGYGGGIAAKRLYSDGDTSINGSASFG